MVAGGGEGISIGSGVCNPRGRLRQPILSEEVTMAFETSAVAGGHIQMMSSRRIWRMYRQGTRSSNISSVASANARVFRVRAIRGAIGTGMLSRKISRSNIRPKNRSRRICSYRSLQFVHRRQAHTDRDVATLQKSNLVHAVPGAVQALERKTAPLYESAAAPIAAVGRFVFINCCSRRVAMQHLRGRTQFGAIRTRGIVESGVLAPLPPLPAAPKRARCTGEATNSR